MSLKDDLTTRAHELRDVAVARLRDANLPLLAQVVEETIIGWSDTMGVCAGRAHVRVIPGVSRRSTVTLSWTIFSQPENEWGFEETVFHELAHVARLRMNHDAVWKELAILLGSTGRRLHTLAVQRPLKLNGTPKNSTHGKLLRYLHLKEKLRILTNQIRGEM